MSFAAEPYEIFVHDLLASATGAVTREERIFLAERSPFPLGEPDAALTDTVRVHGLVDGAFHRFRPDTDFTVSADAELTFLADDSGAPLGTARWPDRGSRFYIAYERRPGTGPPPLIRDRNPGSVIRMLSESFAREYAVMSRQLEKVYQAGFLDTASGRDLDQIAALVGIDRRRRGHAVGEVVFSRSQPAPADIFLPAGLRISSSEPPEVTVETLEKRVLAAGSLSVSAPVQALTAGPDGVASAGVLHALHRPVLGINQIDNPQALRFGSSDEDDEALRRRVRRALEGAGGSTEGALLAALQSIDGIHERDVRVATDHLAAPGTVTVTIATELDDEQKRRAAALLRDNKAAGIRLIHNLDVPVTPRLPVTGTDGDEPSEPPATSAAGDDFAYPIAVRVTVTPADADSSAQDKALLKDAVDTAVRERIDQQGVGEPLIYNRLIGALMSLDGVYDIDLEVFAAAEEAATDGRGNLVPAADKKPRLDSLEVSIRGALIAFDLTVTVELLGLSETKELTSALADIRADLLTRLADIATDLDGTVTPERLETELVATSEYSVTAVSYLVELMDEGLRLRQRDVSIEIDSDHTPWIRSVTVARSGPAVEEDG
ncbi:MAG: baseplate J/gp47 family protein [Acidobacteriota bacterium]